MSTSTADRTFPPPTLPLPPLQDLAPMDAPVVVAGDIHLSPHEPEVAVRFAAFLDAEASRGADIILLGDLFDTWCGPRQAEEPFYARVLETLSAAAGRARRIAFLPGNRDFLFGLGQDLPIEIWPDGVRTTWGARRVMLMHGDRLCTADRAYQGFRRLVRRKDGAARWIARRVPYRLSRRIHAGMRGVSRRETRRKTVYSMGLDYGLARVWLEAADCEVLVAGHVHTGVHHRLPPAGETPAQEVLVLKDWERGGGVVRWSGGDIRLEHP